jgi:hypothetical protein
MDSPACYDPFELLAAIGGLHLLPQNIQQYLDLKLAACMAAAELPKRGDAPTPSRLRRLLAGDPPHRPILHQAPNLLTTTITFRDGCYTVIPGWEEDSDWVVSRVLEAVEIAGHEELRGWAARLARAVLSISAAITSRAGLSRNLPGEVRPLNPAEVPGYSRLRSLADVVRLGADELTEIAGPEWEELLSPVISSLPLTPPDGDGESDYLGSALTWRPLVRDRETGVIVALPGDLLVALRHAVVCRALELGVGRALERAFNDLIARTTLRSLGGLGHLLAEPVPASADPFPHPSWALLMDTDKAIHLLVLGEDLDGYQPSDPFAQCVTLPSREMVERRLTQVETVLLDQQRSLNDILHLVVVQTMGRPFEFVVDQPHPPLFSPRLVFSAPELEAISIVEAPDLLLLWRFARAVTALRRTVPLMPTSQLDELAAWRGAGFSFASLIAAAAGAEDPVQLLPGSARTLREEAARRFDFRGVPEPGGDLVEVERFLEDENVDLYVPRGRLTRPDFLVGGYGRRAVWVVAEDIGGDPRKWEEERKWTELFAYWLWRLRPHLGDLAAAIEAGEEPLVVAVDLHRQSAGDIAAPVSIETVEDRGVRVAIARSRAASLFSGRTNEPERELIAEMLAALGAVVGCGSFDIAAAREITVAHMPPEARKLIFIRHADPAVRPMTAPLRLLSTADIDEVMHEVGTELAQKMGLDIGPIPAELTHDVINSAVRLLFGRLQATVKTLGGKRLLEWLVGANEALVQHGVVRGMELAGEVACYGPETEVVKRRLKLLGEFSATSVSSRFLIEYVAAQPPAGLRPISFSVHDTLLAIASQITELGMLSDLLHYELAEVEAALLPTGRLVAGTTEDHRAAQSIFAGQVAKGDIRRSAASMDTRLTAGNAPEAGDELPNPPYGDQLDAGFEAEYGFSLENAIRGLYALCEVRMQSPAAATIGIAAAEAVVGRETGGESSRARRVIEAFALRPRAAFLPAPAGFDREDLYPWRFNRRLSYLRRPLLIAGDELVYGPAGVFRSIEYLNDLISQGRLRARTKELKQAISRVQVDRGAEFNDRVADLYGERPDCWSQARVEKVGALRIEREHGQPLGDVDVLVLVPRRRLILAIETKALAVALTPHQLHNEIRETFDQAGHSALTRHEERLAWLHAHRREVLAYAEIDDDDDEASPDAWRTVALIAVDEEVLSPLIKRVTMPVRSWQELVTAHADGALF